MVTTRNFVFILQYIVPTNYCDKLTTPNVDCFSDVVQRMVEKYYSKSFLYVEFSVVIKHFMR
jgi:hypothetical protein